MRSVTPTHDLPSRPDIRLVVADLDGTLLDEHGAIPAAFWPLLEDLKTRDITFAPASGRPTRSLTAMFAAVGPELAAIGDNGAHVVRGGQEVSALALAPAFIEQVVSTVRGLTGDLGLVWCGREHAYIERLDAPFATAVRRFYPDTIPVDDLLTVQEEPLQLAVYEADGVATGCAELLSARFAPHRVVATDPQWLNIMDPRVTKGQAVESLQRHLGVTAAQTLAFGDYLNDIELLASAEFSFAMANAHPELLTTARYVAPSNREQGVITTLDRLLGLS